MLNTKIIVTEPSADYELLDSGEGEKLERFGKVVLARPDPQALWSKNLSASEWKKADGYFTHDNKADWSLKPAAQERWAIELGGLKLWVKPTAFKHVGVFPEQASNWKWVESKISGESSKKKGEGSKKNDHSGKNQPTFSMLPASSSELSDSIEILNLFGYTGGATLACAKAGAKVVHVDGSKVAISWARDNALLSGLEKKPVRWILDDARTFVKREVKRGRKYQGIIMDPPSFGHGPEGELWKIEENFLSLVEQCFEILDTKPLFFLINGYAAGYSAIAYNNILLPLKEKFGGSIEMGEVAIKESGTERNLPCGIFARWG